MSSKTQRVKQSTVNTPVTQHVLASKSINKEEAESLLSKFITQHEEDQIKQQQQTATPVEAGYATSLSQLKRVQRDLRGLPPLESVSTTPVPTSKPVESEGKHKTFD